MATMRDVAEKAGVSYTTVSLVLNRRDSSRGIGAETRKRVLQAAEDLAYRPNEFARAVVTGNNHLIAFLSRPAPVNIEFRMRVQTGVLEEASAQGFVVKLLSHNGADSLAAPIEQCIAWRIAGVVATSMGDIAIRTLQAGLAPHGIPIAATEEAWSSDSQFFNVMSDERQGFRLALAHLRDLGHERIGYLASANYKDLISERRIESFRAVRSEFGLPDRAEDILHGHWWDIEPNRRATIELMQRPSGDRPTALVCCGDPAAVTVLNTVRALGMRAPDDLSVIGFGDYTIALFSDPALTTIAQPFSEMGRLAAHRLIEHAKSLRTNDTASLSVPGERSMTTQLAIRESTAPPRKAGS